MRRWSLLLPLCLFCVQVVSAGPQLPQKVKGVTIEPQLNEYIDLELTFRNEDGESVKLQQYFGGKKPVILVLAYFECPRLCSNVLNGLTESMKRLTGQRNFRLGEHYTVLTVSFDPTEKPELAKAKKKTYLEHYGFDGGEKGWHFLTGEQSQIEKLAKTVGFGYRYDEEIAEYIHAAGIMTLTPKGQVSNYFYGISFPPQDLYYGLVEASRFEVSQSVSDRFVLLFCYTYDPNTGKYRFTIINVVRIGGVLTMLCLGIPIYRMIRSERKKRKAVT